MTNHKKITIFFSTLLLLVGWSITQPKFNFISLLPQDKNYAQVMAVTPPSSQNIEGRLVNANTEFAFKLFSQILQQDGDKNVFVSPTSVAIALSLLYNGAAGQTQQQMAEVLELQGMSLAEINPSYQALQEILTNQSEVELSIANSIWLREGFALQPQFLDNNQRYYRAKVTELDFNQPQAKTIINNWVDQATKGKIKEIIDSISREDSLFLINAIYFKGTWRIQFDKNLTQEQIFYLENGKNIKHPLMSQNGQYLYYENEHFQGINLPYGKENNLTMYVFLPKEDSNLTEFINNLTTENWQKWSSEFRQKEGFISLPKFKLEYEIKLNETLQAIGMTDIFSRQANFKNMTPAQVYVDEVKHKTFVEVNEEGTEAAAVTSTGIRAISLPIDEPFRMIVNRPFFYAIRDNQTGIILFMGTILNPS
jgi:serpin B